MKILYAATPAIAVATLDSIVKAGHAVEVLTNPDAPAGRSGLPVASAVKQRAVELGLPVHQPPKLDAAARAALEPHAFDLLVSFAFGKIFGPKFLAVFARGGINVHPSLLPRWRGPSPLTAAILAQDKSTGITVQKLALAMDSGDILAQNERPLDFTETTESLTDWAANEAGALVVGVLSEIERGTATARPQDESSATYCHLVQKEDARIDWALSSSEIDARIRAYHPWPSAFTTWKGQSLMVHRAAVVSLRSDDDNAPFGQVVGVDKSIGILVKTGNGLLALQELQLQSKKSLDFRSFLNGARDLPGSRLGDDA